MNDVELLQALIDEAFDGNQAAFARAIDRQPAQVNQYLKGRRQLGIEVKMHIEQKLRRQGWFGINTSAPARPGSAPSPAAEAGAALSAGDSAAVLNQALDVVLDALAESPHRAELRQLLPMLVDTNAQAYRQRLAELLAPPQRTPPPAAESKDFHPPVPSSLFNKNKQPT